MGKKKKQKEQEQLQEEEQKELQQEYYSMQVACSNCGRGNSFDSAEYAVFIPKGVPVDEFLEHTPCEFCGCNTLSRVMNWVAERIKPAAPKENNEESKGKTADMTNAVDVLGEWVTEQEPKPQKKPKYRKPRVLKVIR